MKNFLYFCLIWAITPFVLNAQIIITEIMYDVEGSDSGREWVEIFNNGNESIDLSDWWFFEGGNHGFQNESAILGVGEYAVIVDSVEKFTLDWSNISSLIIDSSAFSLKNTGEYIAIRDSEKNDIDGLSYSPIDTADGQGYSLQLVSDAWIANPPTPGITNNSEEGVNAPENTTTNQVEDSGIWIEDTKRIYTNAGKDRTVLVGADSLFEGDALGLTKEPIENARYIWNFGDGETKEGQNVLHAYKYPGEYIVFLDVASGKYTASDRIKIKAVPAEIQISNIKEGADGFLELYNFSKEEINLSWWILSSGNNHFTLAEHTYILPDKKVIFSALTTGLVVVDNHSDISLSYPNGKIAIRYQDIASDTIKDSDSRNPISSEVILSHEVDLSDKKFANTHSSSVNTKKEILPLADKKPKEGNTLVKQELDSVNISVASVGYIYAPEHTSVPLYRWFLVLLAIIFLSTSGIIFIASREAQKRKDGIAKYDDIVREIKIIDEV